MHIRLTLKSRNKKTGPIPVSTTSADTCPPACPLMAAGCYAKTGPIALVWQDVNAGRFSTDSWDAFCAQIAALPRGPWRHNQAGDLPGKGNTIDRGKLAKLVDANAKRLGWTYTHKPMNRAANRAAVAEANAGGFTVNLSANTLAEADRLADLAIAPVVVVLDAPEGARADARTPAGRLVVTCPATYRENVTCASCLLCARPGRPTIVGFPGHGQTANAARAIARG